MKKSIRDLLHDLLVYIERIETATQNNNNKFYADTLIASLRTDEQADDSTE